MTIAKPGLVAASISQAANLFWASPDGTTGNMSARAIVAGDLPNHSTALLTSGILALARGGTTFGTYTKGDIIIADNTNSLIKLGIGGSTTVLGVSGGIPAWVTLSGPTVLSGGTKLQSGKLGASPGTTGTVTYGSAFGAVPALFICVNSLTSGGGGSGAYWAMVDPNVAAISATAFGWGVFSANASPANPTNDLYWFAIGT